VQKYITLSNIKANVTLKILFSRNVYSNSFLYSLKPVLYKPEGLTIKEK